MKQRKKRQRRRFGICCFKGVKLFLYACVIEVCREGHCVWRGNYWGKGEFDPNFIMTGLCGPVFFTFAVLS